MYELLTIWETLAYQADTTAYFEALSPVHQPRQLPDALSAGDIFSTVLAIFGAIVQGAYLAVPAWDLN